MAGSGHDSLGGGSGRMGLNHEDEYWADPMHVTAPDRLNECAPEATMELIDILVSGTSPTIGWWRRHLPKGSG